MNRAHRWLCRSAVWKRVLEQHVVPWVLEGLHPGDNVLEIGPGPGLTTDLLLQRMGRLTCLEIDRAAAERLRRRTASDTVHVVCGDATRLVFPDATFDAVVSLTMLHHVPSPALQDRLMAEAARVLRPGGVFLAVDSLQSLSMRLMHLFDTMVPVDPATLPSRLAAAGFENVSLSTNRFAFRVSARRA